MSYYGESTLKEDPNTSWYKTFHLIPEGSLVMDIGCSSGNFGQELISKKGCTVDGIEISKEDIKEAKKKLRNVYEINVEIDPIGIDERYDVIFMGDVIEHLAQPIKALKKIKKLLKPEGALIFSVPNITHMSVRLMLLRGEIKYGKTGLLDETHLHFYNKEELYRVLNSAGFKVSKFDYVAKDVPKDVLRVELAEMGLEMKDKFMELAQSVNGAAYQFIGSAVPGPAEKEDLPPKSPIDVADRYITTWKKEHQLLHDKTQQKLKDILKEKEDLKRELDGLRDSRKWKMVSYIDERLAALGDLFKKTNKRK